MDNLQDKEKKVYDRIATVLNYNRGEGHSAISVHSIADDYIDTGSTSLEHDWKELGYENLLSLLRKFKFHLTPTNMVKTCVPGIDKNGAAAVIDLMQRTRENPKRRYGDYVPRTLPTRQASQISFGPSPRTLAIQNAQSVIPERTLSRFRPVWSEYYVPADPSPAHQTSSEVTLTSSTQVAAQDSTHPSSSSAAAQQQPHKSLDGNGERATSAIHQPSVTVQAVSSENRGPSISAPSTSRAQLIVLSEPETTDSFSGVMTTAIANGPVYVVKTVIFDHHNLNWKVALERPRTVKDAEFFKFCKDGHSAIENFEMVPRDELIKGKCYLVAFNGKYYRGIYIAPSRDNRHGLFDFADFEVVRPILFSTIRAFTKLKQLTVPCMINWVYTLDFPYVERNDRVRCTFLPTFEETGFRKIHQANLQKIQT